MSIGNMQNQLRNNQSSVGSPLSVNVSQFDVIPQQSPSRTPNSRPGSVNSSPDGRNTNHNWHKTSFKIGKPKPSKTRYLTKKELIGVGLSAVVSLIFSLILLALVYYGTPIVAQKFLSFINFGTTSDIQEDAAVHDMSGLGNPKQLMKQTPGVPHKVIKVYQKLTSRTLQEVYINKAPVLFTFQDLSKNKNPVDQTSCLAQTLDNDIHFLSDDEEVQLFSMNHFQTFPYEAFHDNITLPIKAYIATQLSFDVEKRSYLAADSILPKKLNWSISSLLTHDQYIVNSFNGKPKIIISRNDDYLCGSPFHAHNQFLHYLLTGKKHWVIFKQDFLPRLGFNPQQNLRQWLKNHNNGTNKLDSNNVFHVFQEEGEVLYVPEGWYHASDVLSDIAIGVSFHSIATQPSSYYYYMNEGIQRVRNNDLQGGMRLFKLGLGINRNIQLLKCYADALILAQSYTAAEEVLREILQENPQDPNIYSKLINMMINHANKDISGSISELLDQADQYGIRDTVLFLSQQNL